MQNSIDWSLSRDINNSMALKLACMLGIMVACAVVVWFVARLLFFWLPANARDNLSQSLAVLGLIPGLWVAVEIMLR
jgi:hypothetical protein